MSEDGSSSIIKKSAVVWLLSESKGKLSNDRLKRVQARKENESNGPKRIYKPPSIIKSAQMGESAENPRGILVLGLWYTLSEDFTLETMLNPSFFINIDNYVATVNAPEIDSTKKRKLIGNISEMKISISLLFSSPD